MMWYAHGFGSALDGVPENIHHLFGLVLNPMRGNTEEQRLICVSDYRHEVEALLEGEKVEPYGDPGESSFGHGATVWHKAFRKDGPLEWFNPPGDVYCETGIVELRRNGWQRVA